VLSSGIFVGLHKVPASNTDWTNAPFEAQYLKLYDVTPPPTPAAPAAPNAYVIGTNVTFSWSGVTDTEGGVSGYHLYVGTNAAGSNVFSGVVGLTSNTVSGNYGQVFYARVSAVNNAGIEGAVSGTSTATILLDPAGDYDGDGMSNAAEAAAGTDPLDPNSVLKITNFTLDKQMSWLAVSGRTYQVLMTTNIAQGFAPISGVISAGSASASYQDIGATNANRFYRVRLVP
jgi:hypothetical protein